VSGRFLLCIPLNALTVATCSAGNSRLPVASRTQPSQPGGGQLSTTAITRKTLVNA
jgi:hypothetical protein